MTAAPFWHCGRTVQGNSIHTLFALSLVIAMAFWHWGIPVLGVVGLSVLVSVLTEEFWNTIMGRHSTFMDGTAAVSGVLFSLSSSLNRAVLACHYRGILRDYLR